MWKWRLWYLIIAWWISELIVFIYTYLLILLNKTGSEINYNWYAVDKMPRGWGWKNKTWKITECQSANSFTRQGQFHHLLLIISEPKFSLHHDFIFNYYYIDCIFIYFMQTIWFFIFCHENYRFYGNSFKSLSKVCIDVRSGV